MQAVPAAAQTGAQTSTPTPPERFFKQPPGTDYYLANYSEYEAYLQKLATQSDRMKLVDIGKSAEGRSQWMAIVSSPANLAKLDEYRAIAEKLARAHGVDEAQARALAARTPPCPPAQSDAGYRRSADTIGGTAPD